MNHEEYEQWQYFTDSHITCGETECRYNYNHYCTSDAMNQSGICIMEPENKTET